MTISGRDRVMSDETPPSSLPTPEQILSALDHTGFVLEYRAAQRLRQFGFETFLNHAFTDPETGKSREVDILATVYNNIKVEGKYKVLINATLVIECKNYSDPLVVIGQDEQLRYHNDQPLITFDPLLISFAARDPEVYGSLPMALDMLGLPSHSTRGFIGSQLIKMHRQGGKWRAANDSVYDSITYPLAKAVENERKRASDLSDDDRPWHVPGLVYLFAVLITAGNIFAVNVVPDGTPTVTAVKWVPLVRNFSEDEFSFMMDVVTFDSIEEYLKERVFPTLKEANQSVSSHLELFNPEWLRKQYGKSSDPIFIAWLEDIRPSGGSAK